MATPEEKLNKLKELLKMLNESITKKDFVDAFENVVKLVKGIQAKNEGEIAAMWENIRLLGQRLASNAADDWQELKGNITALVTSKLGDMDSKMARIKEGRDGKDGKDGRDGQDGNDADEESIIQRVLAKIPPVDLSPFDARLNDIDTKVRQFKGVTVFGPGKTKVIILDLSSQLDGTTKRFRIGTNFGIVGVSSSSSPFGAFRPILDYSGIGADILFADAVDAPSMLAAGQSLIITYLK